MNDYETAKAALQHAVDHPDAFSADDLEALTEVVKAGQPHEKQGSAADFGEHSSLGATGLEEGSPAETQLGETKRRYEGEAKAAAEHPEIVKALKASGLPAGMPIKTAEEQAQLSRTGPEYREHYDQNLPSASQRKEFFTPPEYTPPESLALFPSPTGMGSFEQGKVKLYTEPSVDEFHAELGPVYGERVLRLGKASNEYKEWADIKWRNAVEEAKKNGVAIVRHEYAGTPEMRSRRDIGVKLGGFLGSFADAAMGGAGTKVVGDPNAPLTLSPQETGRASPAVAIPGEIGGALANPFFRAAGELIPVTGPLSGAASGVMGGAINKAAGLEARKLTGENVSPQQELQEIGTDAGLAGALGGLGGGISGLAGKAGEKLRRDAPHLEKLEKGGYAKTSVLHGIEPGPEMVKAEDLAREQGFVDKATGEPLVAKREALSLVKPFTEEARARESAGAKYTNETKQAIYEANKNKLVSTKPVLDAIEDAENSSSRVDHEGRPLTPEAARELKQLARMKEFLVDPEFSHLTGHQVARALEPEAVDGLIKQIQQLDEKALRQGAATGKKPLPDFERIKAAAHSLRDQIQMLGEETPREELTAAATPSKGGKGGYSKFLRERSEEMGQRHNERQALGLPTQDKGVKILPERLDFDQTTAARNAIMNAEPEAESVIRDFAKATGKEATLDRLRAYQAYENLKHQARITGRLRLGNLHPMESVSGHGIALRLDPILSKLGPAAGGAGRLAPTLRHRLGGPLESLMAKDKGPSQPATIDEINQLLDPLGGPFAP